MIKVTHLQNYPQHRPPQAAAAAFIPDMISNYNIRWSTPWKRTKKKNSETHSSKLGWFFLSISLSFCKSFVLTLVLCALCMCARECGECTIIILLCVIYGVRVSSSANDCLYTLASCPCFSVCGVVCFGHIICIFILYVSRL